MRKQFIAFLSGLQEVAVQSEASCRPDRSELIRDGGDGFAVACTARLCVKL